MFLFGFAEFVPTNFLSKNFTKDIYYRYIKILSRVWCSYGIVLNVCRNERDSDMIKVTSAYFNLVVTQYPVLCINNVRVHGLT